MYPSFQRRIPASAPISRVRSIQHFLRGSWINMKIHHQFSFFILCAGMLSLLFLEPPGCPGRCVPFWIIFILLPLPPLPLVAFAPKLDGFGLARNIEKDVLCLIIFCPGRVSSRTCCISCANHTLYDDWSPVWYPVFGGTTWALFFTSSGFI